MGELKVLIKCDKCDFKTKQDQDIHKWLNKKCPDCGYILITEADIMKFNIINFISKKSQEYIKKYPRCKTEKVRFDSVTNKFTKVEEK